MNVVLLFSYGHLKSIEDLEPFYKHLLRKHYSEASLVRGKALFSSLGKTDPLTSITIRIGQAISEILKERTGEDWISKVGTKHSAPFVDDIIAECVNEDVKRILTVPLTPLSSITGTEAYQRKVMDALPEEAQIAVYHLEPYYAEESFIRLLQQRLQTAFQWLANDEKKHTVVVFTTHSLPGVARVHENFIAQYRDLAVALMDCEQLKKVPYQIAYRSGGPLPQKWLRPDILDVIDECAERKVRAVVVCELLSIIENAEVIEEIGREAMERALGYNMSFVQTEFLNDAFDFVKILGDLCVKRLTQSPEQLFQKSVIPNK